MNINRVSGNQPPQPNGFFTGLGKSLGSWYSTHVQGDHRYETWTPVAKADRVERSQAEEALAKFPTPNPGTLPATPLGTINAIPGLGTVTSTLHANGEVSNVAHPGHLLYPGTVSGSVREKDGTLYSVRVGTGTGILPAANVGMANLVWNFSDQRIADQVNPGYAEERRAVTMDTAMAADPYDLEATLQATFQGFRLSDSVHRKYLG